MIRNRGEHFQVRNALQIDVYVSYLRRKIDADYPTKLIHTVWGVGWVLREEV